MQKDKELFDSMRNIVILNSLHFSYPLPILMRVSYNTLIVKQNTSDYYKYSESREENGSLLTVFRGVSDLLQRYYFSPISKERHLRRTEKGRGSKSTAFLSNISENSSENRRYSEVIVPEYCTVMFQELVMVSVAPPVLA